MSIKNCAKYDLVCEGHEYIVIQDVGPHDQYLTVTNAAEMVVQDLWATGALLYRRRLFYADSDGIVSELMYAVNDSKPTFTGYATIIMEDSIGQVAKKAYETSNKS